MAANFLDFEQPIADLFRQLEKIHQLENEIREKRLEIYSKLTVWQRIQVSRHPDRPYSLFYIENICDKFIELFGDRNFKDDKAIIGGLGNIDGKTYMFIGH